ncbi:MAG: hypothetical protein M3004_10285 [Bacteroidota bacterium]|nr:hypothetical protein [Bacteroidota bacterium]
MTSNFLFATGIENSIPTIDNGWYRMDEMEKCRPYKYWEKDLELVKEMGINFLRYGQPLYKTFLGENKFDWSFSDKVFQRLQN